MLTGIIRRVAPDGTIGTYAGAGGFAFAGDGGPARDAVFAGPTGISARGDGTLFIVDQTNKRIRRVDRQGIVTTVAGGGSVDCEAN